MNQPSEPLTYESIAQMIDHSLLNPTLTDAELEAGLRLARAYGVATVCIKPYYLARAAEVLAGSVTRPSTTIGFPHGGHTTDVKVAEARAALADGGIELDLVANIGKVKSGDWAYVQEDLRAVVEEVHSGGGLVKVIFENAYLTDEEKVRLCEICSEVGADFVKTSTGYAPSGATHEDLILMRRHAAPHVQVKAAGGVRTLDALLAVRELGTTRAGATATKVMLDELRQRLGLPPIEIPDGDAVAPAGY